MRSRAKDSIQLHLGHTRFAIAVFWPPEEVTTSTWSQATRTVTQLPSDPLYLMRKVVCKIRNHVWLRTLLPALILHTGCVYCRSLGVSPYVFFAPLGVCLFGTLTLAAFPPSSCCLLICLSLERCREQTKIEQVSKTMTLFTNKTGEVRVNVFFWWWGVSKWLRLNNNKPRTNVILGRCCEFGPENNSVCGLWLVAKLAIIPFLFRLPPSIFGHRHRHTKAQVQTQTQRHTRTSTHHNPHTTLKQRC